MAIITLTTDFGLQDAFVGTLRGVILGLCPEAQVLDLTHGIAAGDIRSGAFALASAVPYFPPGTIHVAVVDPGVGSERAALAVRTQRSVFIGPDNGLLDWAARAEGVVEVRRLDQPRYWLPYVSRTFQGRDVFAPVAAHLARGERFDRVGRRVKNFIRMPLPTPVGRGGTLTGEVIHVDRFGNATTNLDAATFSERRWRRARFVVGKHSVGPLRTHYASVPPGQPLVLEGSTGRLEVAVYRGSAAVALGVKIGTRITAQAQRPERGSPVA